jgi:hypothetical protein
VSTPPRALLGSKKADLAEQRRRRQRERERERERMATRRAALQLWPAANGVAGRMEEFGRVPRYFSDKASGRVLSEEERAAENVYIQVTIDLPLLRLMIRLRVRV